MQSYCVRSWYCKLFLFPREHFYNLWTGITHVKKCKEERVVYWNLRTCVYVPVHSNPGWNYGKFEVFPSWLILIKLTPDLWWEENIGLYKTPSRQPFKNIIFVLIPWEFYTYIECILITSSVSLHFGISFVQSSGIACLFQLFLSMFQDSAIRFFIHLTSIPQDHSPSHAPGLRSN